jgi:hypothetical protein
MVILNHSFVLERLQCLRFGCLVKLRLVLCMTHAGTRLLLFSALMSLFFLAVGLFLANRIISSLS